MEATKDGLAVQMDRVGAQSLHPQLRESRGRGMDVPNGLNIDDGDQMASSVTSSLDSNDNTTHNTTPIASSDGIVSPAGLHNSTQQIPTTDARSTAQRFGTITPQGDQIFDMICVGFGPASLAIAIALAEKYADSNWWLPKVLFLEKQEKFAWHAGMQIADAKMQISFLKDLATPRNPMSPFTFINYLHVKGRLHHFINLGTFLPSRREYDDYMSWCASHFNNAVSYGCEVTNVDCGEAVDCKINGFKVHWTKAGSETQCARARHVVVAAGGRPFIPPEFQGLQPVLKHSSQYVTTISSPSLEMRDQHFAVIGSGQSAAEIFNDLWSRYPTAKVNLIIKGAALRPSDDSPFVNEVFDPDRVTPTYEQDATERSAAIQLDRGTNYGVVRLTLLEHIYEKLYLQRLQQPNERKWRCRILPNRSVISAAKAGDGSQSVTLRIAPTNDLVAGKDVQMSVEEVKATLVFVATGYLRNAHEELLGDTSRLLPQAMNPKGPRFPVGRNYRVLYDPEKVDESCGVWLQGCNESTHGLSDTLLSILAVRGGEMVESIFGADR